MLVEADALAAALADALGATEGLLAGAIMIAPEELDPGSFALLMPGTASANTSNDSGKHFMSSPRTAMHDE
jgi:hypothetical protein